MLGQNSTYPINSPALLNTLRKLWGQHTIWTRSYINSSASNHSDLPYVTKRLLKTPVDLSGAIKLFYGKERSNRLKHMLTDYILIGIELAGETKEGNQRRIKELLAQWEKLTQEISYFFASINPYWHQSEWQALFNRHIKLTKTQAKTRYFRSFKENIKIYDELEDSALDIADYMYYGITKQFYVEI